MYHLYEIWSTVLLNIAVHYCHFVFKILFMKYADVKTEYLLFTETKH